MNSKLQDIIYVWIQRHKALETEDLKMNVKQDVKLHCQINGYDFSNEIFKKLYKKEIKKYFPDEQMQKEYLKNFNGGILSTLKMFIEPKKKSF